MREEEFRKSMQQKALMALSSSSELLVVKTDNSFYAEWSSVTLRFEIVKMKVINIRLVRLSP